MLQEKIIWITGASSGIGRALAIQLAKLGAKLVLSARNESELMILKSELVNSERHLVLAFDLGVPNDMHDYVQTVLNNFQRIDFLYNCGGISQRGEAIHTTMEVDRKIMEVNYFGTIALSKAVLQKMRSQQSGHIVVISSIAGKFGFFQRSAYSASKHALHGFFESLYLEEKKNNIKVTIACPGKIKTNISLNALSAKGDKHGQMDENQNNGMSAEECASQIINAVKRNKLEVYIGKKEIWAVYIKRLFPKLFWRIIEKQKSTE